MILSPEDLAQLEETLDVLSDPDALSDLYELVVAPPAVRAIQAGLPEAVAAAVIEFLTGALIADPRRAGKPLRGDLAGIHAARRGTYRVLYRINETRHEVVVQRIDRRRDAYRPR